MKKTTTKKQVIVDEESRDFAKHFQEMVTKSFSKIIKHNKPISVSK